jgi:hypothetical protein
VGALAVATCLAARPASAEERPFVFSDDARLPTPGSAEAMYRGTWGLAGSDAVRPIGSAALGATGSIHELQGEVGILPWLSLRGYGLLFLSQRDDSAFTTGGLEVRARLVGGARQPFGLTLSAGALREFNGYASLQGRIVATGAIGPVRLTGDVLVERSFRPRADSFDVITVAAVSYQLHPIFRVGVEYVGQDLEALWDPREIEGFRQMVGPSLSVHLAPQRLQAFAGTLFGVAPGTPPVTVRLGLVYTVN